MATVLFVFLDGFGLGEPDAAVNPVAAARLPWFAGRLGGPPLLGTDRVMADRVALAGVDAGLGVAGTPQSGTGQTALLTGENAARLFGRHFGPWVPTRLRPLLGEKSVLARAAACGRRVAFANAYPRELLDGGSAPAGREVGGRSGRIRLPRAGPPLAALAAGVLDRDASHLARGDAVASEITNDGWREQLNRPEVPPVSPEEAGANLARISAGHDLTLFAHYSLDYVGHRGTHAEAVAALERVDAFLAGVDATLRDGSLLIVASDHGNIEDVRVGHTRNPALVLAVGEGAEAFVAPLRRLTDVAPAILRRLGCVSV